MTQNNSSSNSSRSRICLIILMNHPFPSVIPFIRKLYKNKFDELLFVIPFERSADSDVLTCYRGSYTHFSYLSDVAETILALDCDYFIVTHDDVLLNPNLSSTTFADYFPMRPDEAFLPLTASLPAGLGDWGWLFGAIPKLLFPKSLIFGSGIEFENLIKFLPSAEGLRSAFRRHDIQYTEEMIISEDHLNNVVTQAAKVMIFGLQGSKINGAERAIEDAAVETAKSLSGLILRAIEAQDGEKKVDGKIKLPLPLITSAFYTDFVVLGKDGLKDFLHFAGVAGAANLFVEIFSPTLLYACYKNVRLAEDFGLDFSGFQEQKDITYLSKSTNMAIHPFKLSKFVTIPSEAERLISTLDSFIDASLSLSVQPSSVQDFRLLYGWHVVEDWGVWASEEAAIIKIVKSSGERVKKLRLFAPVCESVPIFSVTLLGANINQELHFDLDRVETEIEIDANENSTIVIQSGKLLCPRDIDPRSSDFRRIGIGIAANHG